MLAVGSYQLSVISYRFLRPGGQARGYTSRTGKKLPEINQKFRATKTDKTLLCCLWSFAHMFLIRVSLNPSELVFTASRIENRLAGLNNREEKPALRA